MNRKKFCLLLSGLLLTSLPTWSYCAVILQYHHVSDSTPTITSISPTLFEKHLNIIEKNNFQVWSLPKIVQFLKRQKDLPNNVVAITFDDAFLNIYDNAFPKLQARNWPFTLFVSTQPIDEKNRSYMSWDQLREMTSHGGTIANHTHSHVHLVRQRIDETLDAWRDRTRWEISHAEKRLSAELGERPKYLAYPYGEFTAEIETIVKEMGYVGFGQQSGAVGLQSPLASLPRFPMNNNYGALNVFRDKLRSLPLPIKKAEPDFRIFGNHAAFEEGLTLFFHPQQAQWQQLACYFSGKGKVVSQLVSNDPKGVRVRIPELPELPTGRSRLNCTVPSSLPELSGRFHWYSQFWMRPLPSGEWYPEP